MVNDSKKSEKVPRYQNLNYNNNWKFKNISTFSSHNLQNIPIYKYVKEKKYFPFPKIFRNKQKKTFSCKLSV